MQAYDPIWEQKKKTLRRQLVEGESSKDATLPAIVVNIFCKTGKGGGIDPTCKAGGVGGRGQSTSTSSAPKSETAKVSTSQSSAKSVPKTDLETGIQHTMEHLSKSSFEAGNNLYGKDKVAHPGGLTWEPVKEVIHQKLSQIVKNGEMLADFDYIYYPSQPGKGLSKSGHKFAEANKKWADKDGNIYIGTGDHTTIVVKVDVPFSKLKKLSKSTEKVDKTKKYGNFYHGQTVTVKEGYRAGEKAQVTGLAHDGTIDYKFPDGYRDSARADKLS